VLRNKFAKVPATLMRARATKRRCNASASRNSFCPFGALAPERTPSFGRSVLERVGIAVIQIEAIIVAAKPKDYAGQHGVGGAEPETAMGKAQ
jgi:hypothetical protein